MINEKNIDIFRTIINKVKIEYDSIFENIQYVELSILIDLIFHTFKNTNGKLMFFGNGGSASDSSHIAAEFVNKFSFYRKALPAISLCSDVAVLTSIANDLSYNDIFARQIKAIGNDDDVAIALSTSGKSKNIHDALEVCKDKSKNISTVLFTGKDLDTSLKDNIDLVIQINSNSTPRIQETYMIYWHIVCKIIDDYYINIESK